MKRRQYKVLGIFAILSVLILNYQNCGAKGAGGASTEASSDGGTMGVINPVNTGGIQFTESKATVSSLDEELNIVGLCSVEQSGAFIKWSLQDNDGNELFEGRSLCDRGSFEVAFENVKQLACNSKLQLKAVFGAKAKTQIEIQKNCN
ncbi:MAG: hypothetical protein K2Q26_03030 [Bdellovibrionales bacterium]|nr:hypothetical protein [Bdellovibrionales bacterium]